jgi:hypothetical protein
MPLAFDTLEGDRVAFGFFHIETDLLLLERRFFWCRGFCAALDALLEVPVGLTGISHLPGWRIDSAAALGDLHGALAGDALHGLIGALYARWPFPARRAEFRQKPDGQVPPAQVEALLDRFGTRTTFALRMTPGVAFDLDGTRFTPAQFARLAEYVWRGGMPGWAAGVRPAYLAEAVQRWRAAPAWLAGIDFAEAAVGYGGW